MMVIGEKKTISESYMNKSNIIIWYGAPLIKYNDGLAFDYKKNKLIKNVIYSLAYYQKQHDIKKMSAHETLDVYRKIYYKIR